MNKANTEGTKKTLKVVRDCAIAKIFFGVGGFWFSTNCKHALDEQILKSTLPQKLELMQVLSNYSFTAGMAMMLVLLGLLNLVVVKSIERQIEN